MTILRHTMGEPSYRHKTFPTQIFRKLLILGVIENMSYLHCPHCGEPIEVFARSQREWAITDTVFEQLGRIPLHMSLSRGIETGHPLLHTIPDSPEAVAFRRLA